MIAEGNSAKKIASVLGLSVKTVEAHRFNLMRKLDIHNRAQLVTYAIQKKIVHVPRKLSRPGIFEPSPTSFHLDRPGFCSPLLSSGAP